MHLTAHSSKPNALVYRPQVSEPAVIPAVDTLNVAAIRREVLAELEQILALLAPTRERPLDS